MVKMIFNRNCKSFQGIYSCDILKTENYKDCSECKFYEKIDKKILILKLGALGDVIRTTTILPALKNKYGRSCHITWLTQKNAKELLHNNQYIDRILTLNLVSFIQLQQESFDILLSLEIDPPVTLLANSINAENKFGYYFNKDGHPSPFNKSAESYLDTVFSDFKNKENKRTYQEMIFEISELKYEKQPYILNLKEDEKYIPSSGKWIGINIGSADRWPSKSWHSKNIKELIRKLSKEYNSGKYPKCPIILLGGKKEHKLKQQIIEDLKKENIKVEQNDSNNTLRQFISIINRCSLIIAGDTLALHIAIALKKLTIALFFCTPPWQIESYNLVKKISSPLLDRYFMDDQYYENLTKSISAEEVLKKCKQLLL